MQPYQKNSPTDQVSGASQEWAKGVLGTRYAYTVELPDTGKHGFVLPANMIKNTARGMHSAMKTLLREVIYAILLGVRDLKLIFNCSH